LAPSCTQKDTKTGLIYLSNSLYLIEQTLKGEEASFVDFCSQLRGRFIGDSAALLLPDLKLNIQKKVKKGSFTSQEGSQDEFNATFFENFHHTLRENPRIDVITRMPGSQVLAIKFFCDKKKIIISLSCGLMLLYNSVDC